MTIRLRLLIVGLLLALAVPLLGSSTAHAHTGKQSYVYLEIFDTAIAGRVEYPIADLNRVLGLDIPLGGTEGRAAIEESAGVIQAYTREHLSIGPADGSTPWPYDFEDVDFLDLGGRSYAVFDFEITRRFDPPPREFTVSYDAIIEAGERDGFLLIATDWGSGTFNNEAGAFLRFSEGDTTHLVDLDDTSWLKGMRGVIILGADHIRIGTDHILFVFALVLPSVLSFAKWRDDDTPRWHPSARFRTSLWRVLKIVSMFTVADSITLALGGLGVVELSPRLVETIIAVSIAAAAIHNIHPIFVNREWMLAFGFGLFHGFGFAGLLSELGLDRSNRIPSLLGFNIGVELGQAAIILMIFPLLFIMRRTPWYQPAMYVGSIILAAVAMAWATERIFNYDLRVNELVDPLLRWPRSVVVVVVGYVCATALWWISRRRNELLPITDADADDDSSALRDAAFADV